jgi:hypothetical protein
MIAVHLVDALAGPKNAVQTTSKNDNLTVGFSVPRCRDGGSFTAAPNAEVRLIIHGRLR